MLMIAYRGMSSIAQKMHNRTSMLMKCKRILWFDGATSNAAKLEQRLHIFSLDEVDCGI